MIGLLFAKIRKFIPMAMVVGRLNSVLLEAGVRHLASIVCISARERLTRIRPPYLWLTALRAIYPYLFYATVYDICKTKRAKRLSNKKSLKNAHHAIDLGFQRYFQKWV